MKDRTVLARPAGLDTSVALGRPAAETAPGAAGHAEPAVVGVRA